MSGRLLRHVLVTVLASGLGATSLLGAPLDMPVKQKTAAPTMKAEPVQYIRGPRFRGDTADFRFPRVRGAVVDACAVWGQACGEGGASQYCRYRNFNRALSWSIFYPGQTYVMGSSRFCTGAQCRGLSFVRCG